MAKSERMKVFELNGRGELVLAECVAALRHDELVLLPTETVYGLAARASSEAAVTRLLDFKGRMASQPLTLAISDFAMLDEFIPELVGLPRRLARRCFPGPVTLVLETPASGAMTLLPPAVRPSVLRDGFAGFRVPSHPFVLELLSTLGEPLVLTSANRSGEPPAQTRDELMALSESGIATVVHDATLLSSGTPSTVVRVAGMKAEIIRDGAISAATLARLSTTMILFVCTGNTCRSPMAEVLCESLLAERLCCARDELEERGYVVLSAGLMAYDGQPASEYAKEAMARRGLSLAQHQSQQVTSQHIRFADSIITMTHGHRDAILCRWLDADSRLSLLRPDGGDIADPFGRTATDYERCAAAIDAALQIRVKEFV